MRPAQAIAITSLLAAFAIDAASADVLIKVDKASQRLSVAVDGIQKYEWPVSTARAGYVTPNGDYRPIRLDRTWYSRKYFNSPMPYSIFFRGGYAIHGSFERAEIGRPASHGCVRLDPKNAEVLFDLVQAEGPDKTRIMIDGPGATSVEVHSAEARHGAKFAAARPSLAVAMGGKLSAHGARMAYIEPHVSPMRTAGPQPLVDPFSELISYVRNHTD